RAVWVTYTRLGPELGGGGSTVGFARAIGAKSRAGEASASARPLARLERRSPPREPAPSPNCISWRLARLGALRAERSRRGQVRRRHEPARARGEPGDLCLTVGMASTLTGSGASEAPSRTHSVFNQPPPLEGVDVFSSNLPLVEATGREGAGWVRERAAELGRL